MHIIICCANDFATLFTCMTYNNYNEKLTSVRFGLPKFQSVLVHNDYGFSLIANIYAREKNIDAK